MPFSGCWKSEKWGRKMVLHFGKPWMTKCLGAQSAPLTLAESIFLLFFAASDVDRFVMRNFTKFLKLSVTLHVRSKELFFGSVCITDFTCQILHLARSISEKRVWLANVRRELCNLVCKAKREYKEKAKAEREKNKPLSQALRFAAEESEHKSFIWLGPKTWDSHHIVYRPDTRGRHCRNLRIFQLFPFSSNNKQVFRP